MGVAWGHFFREMSVWEGQECADSTPILLSCKLQKNQEMKNLKCGDFNFRTDFMLNLKQVIVA